MEETDADLPAQAAGIRNWARHDPQGLLTFLGSLFAGTTHTAAPKPRKANVAQSVHFGLNSVDPEDYAGWSGVLRGCENDAQGMLKRFAGIINVTLSSRACSWKAMSAQIARALQSTDPGKTCLITYSGHGGQLAAPAAIEEADKLNETWCAYDGQVLDDDVYRTIVFNQQPGARVVVISDSCHSGGMMRLMGDPLWVPKAVPFDLQPIINRAQSLDLDRQRVALSSHKWTGGHPPACGPIAWIGACQENQVAFDGPANGAFTVPLLATWDAGFDGTWVEWVKAITRRLSQQSPKLECFGPGNEEFLDERVFA